MTDRRILVHRRDELCQIHRHSQRGRDDSAFRRFCAQCRVLGGWIAVKSLSTARKLPDLRRQMQHALPDAVEKAYARMLHGSVCYLQADVYPPPR
jgi:hypothetical protein